MRSINHVFILLLLLTFSSCRTDFDIEEVAPAEYLESVGQDDHNHSEGEDCIECESESEDPDHISIDEQVEESHAGHAHASGSRNHGTEWFFNQPWAAPFIWNKLIRDGLIFLALATAIFLFSGKRKKK